MAFYQPSFEMFENKHFSEISNYPHVEPSTLMPFQLENPDWMAKEHMENNNTTWSYDYSFQHGMYSHEEPYEYRSSVDPADLSPSSDGESDAVWSPSTSKCSSLLPTPVKEELVNPMDCIPTHLAPSIERTPSPEQTTAVPTRTTTAVSKKRESTISNTSRKSAASSTDPNDMTAMKRKKAAHNAIEKRYRTNMNAKFVALGNAIPTFRQRQGLNGSGKSSSKKSLSLKDGATVSSTQPLPQNKSEVLTNALAYINELQEQNRLLQSELTVLKGNLMGHAQPMWRPVGMP